MQNYRGKQIVLHGAEKIGNVHVIYAAIHPVDPLEGAPGAIGHGATAADARTDAIVKAKAIIDGDGAK